jgi:hypothetical protein
MKSENKPDLRSRQEILLSFMEKEGPLQSPQHIDITRYPEPD